MGLFLGQSLPPPDGAITAPDRAAAGWAYSGLTYSAIVASVFINIAQNVARAIVRRIAFDPVSTRKDQQ
jgi:hypothetical protein